jgi:hypothetical protein
MASLIGLFCLNRNSSGIGNCATTFEPFVIRRIILFFCLSRHSIERFPHVDFRLFLAETSALKNLLASTSYFIERRARYSLADVLSRIAIYLFVGALSLLKTLKVILALLRDL